MHDWRRRLPISTSFVSCSIQSSPYHQSYERVFRTFKSFSRGVSCTSAEGLEFQISTKVEAAVVWVSKWTKCDLSTCSIYRDIVQSYGAHRETDHPTHQLSIDRYEVIRGNIMEQARGSTPVFTYNYKLLSSKHRQIVQTWFIVPPPCWTETSFSEPGKTGKDAENNNPVLEYGRYPLSSTSVPAELDSISSAQLLGNSFYYGLFSTGWKVLARSEPAVADDLK